MFFCDVRDYFVICIFCVCVFVFFFSPFFVFSCFVFVCFYVFVVVFLAGSGQYGVDRHIYFLGRAFERDDFLDTFLVLTSTSQIGGKES